MRSNPLNEAAQGIRQRSSVMIRTDQVQSPGELLTIENNARIGALIAVGFAVLVVALGIAQASDGSFDRRNVPIFVIVVCGILLGALMMYGFSRLARTLRLARTPPHDSPTGETDGGAE